MAQPLHAVRITVRRVMFHVAVMLVAPVALLAQASAWSLTAELGQAMVGGASFDPATGAAVRPAQATVVGLAIGRQVRGLRVGVAVRYTRSNLAIADDEVTIQTRDLQFTLYEVAPDLTLPVRRVGQYARLRLALGPVVEVWSLTQASIRLRIGVRAALAMETRLGRRLSGVVRVEGVLSGSLFEPGELPPGFERRGQFRRLILLGLRVGRG